MTWPSAPVDQTRGCASPCKRPTLPCPTILRDPELLTGKRPVSVLHSPQVDPGYELDFGRRIPFVPPTNKTIANNAGFLVRPIAGLRIDRMPEVNKSQATFRF